ncbi:hypothetical protein [Streptomyces clavuligerus]|uniref:Uncharacterized protein n=1 Tax=Streptomyces clavuligerus TaxID=1901 RepID=Q6TMV3_STRCL|nr:hypothetical protein [Streptomyces clavuligerus]AAQ93519.1 hypothetical protein pSCL2.2.26.11 [Streptomyces clavuligerus]AXU16785.1 hypothetical protein D1794_28860 [Streptomyces clavuligerus]EDY48820.1 conserved hypothetical protein [Streptomyces clavuligerus]MBY6300914.1 hypothetical protein [Streptomyces clavuligerus]QPJ97067.1 hypothetical protein GE265_28595 [Streptomyces clavuligerus]
MFGYLRAIHADDTEAARGFATTELRMPELLVDAATRIIIPVTALPGDGSEPCEDVFALEALGSGLVTALEI